MNVGRDAKRFAKKRLVGLGEHIPQRLIDCGNSVLNYAALGSWIKPYHHAAVPVVDTRHDLYELLARDISKRRVLFLEFGVFEGASLKAWSQLLTGPEVVFAGFDSFDGLPEDWTSRIRLGHFSTSGALPMIDDPRVHVYAGWFAETLPTYQLPQHEMMIAHLDADLYSSTQYVLAWLAPRLRVGDYLCFDELNERDHELKALKEFIESNDVRLRLLAGTAGFVQAAFVVEEIRPSGMSE